MSISNAVTDSGNGTTPPASAAKRGRIEALDAARGIALVAMAVYHFTWDLEFYGYVEAGTAGAGGWKIFARLIAGSFLFLAGFSLFIGNSPAIRYRAFLTRLAKIAAAALAITVATWFAFPEAFIFFGILHSIAAASLIGLLFLRLPAPVTLIIAAAVFAAPLFLRSAVFDAPWLWWVGLSQTPPRSNDYVPLLPWLAPFLLGLAAAKIMSPRGLPRRSHPGQHTRVSRPKAGLAFAGRHSLAIYLVHQPLLIGMVYVFSLGFPAARPDPVEAFRTNCVASCSIEQSATLCTTFCGCTLDGLLEQGLFEPLNAGQINAQTDDRILRITEQCTMDAQAKE